jgi:ATP-dependent Lon protease
MIDQDGQTQKPLERHDIDPSNATREDLFAYGVSGVEGRGTGEFALLVEGIARVRIDKLTQERPFFEAEIIHVYDEGRHSKNACTLYIITY